MNNFKRFLSVFVAAMLVLSSLKSVDSIVNAVQTDENAVTYNFEDGEASFLDFGTQWNTYNKDFDNDGVIDGAFVKVMTENEGTEQENKFLRIQNQTYKNLIVNFPFKLKNDTSYRISYKIRDDGASHIYQSATAGSGIYIGKATGKTAIAESQQCEVSDYLGAKLHNLYGDNGSYVVINKSAFTEVSFTFSVGENAVADGFSHLAINYFCQEKNGSAYEYIDIDDIVIEKVSAIHFKAYVGDTESTDISVAPVEGTAGEKVTFDRLRVPDYDLVGIYTDPELSIPFEGNELTIADTVVTYYLKYAKKNYSSADYDFETYDKSFLDFGTHWNTYNKDFDNDGNIDGAFAKVMTENEGTKQENKYLRIQNQTYKNLIVNFPFKLKNGASYRFSYKIRDDGASHIYQAESAGSGIYLGKATGKTAIAESQQCEVPDYLGAKLHNLYGDNGSYVVINKPEFTEVSFTFTVGENVVSGDFCYLAINYFCQEKNGSAFEYIDIDDIKIEMVSSIRFKAYVGDTESTDISVAPVEGNPGSTVTFDCLSIAGYDVEGIYTDPALTTKFTDNVFTIPTGNITYYIKYVRNEDIYRFKMENSSDIKKNKDQAMIMEDPVNPGNNVLAFGKHFRESIAAFPYELTPNTKYTLKLSYRSSSKGIVPRLYVYGVKDDSELLDGSSTGTDYLDKRIFSIMDALNSSSANSTGVTVTDNFGQWITKEYVFDTGDKIDGDYKYFALGGKVQHTANDSAEYLLIDNIEIKKLDATVSFNVSYNGQKIDVPSTYPSVGDTITLPTAITNPFELEGWYYDSACTQAVGSTLTVTNKNTVLYGKTTKKNTYTIDFEDNTDLVYSGGNWFGIGSVVTTDPDNSENHVLKTRATAFGNYVLVRLNYQLQSNRIYEISVKYRGVDQSASIALIASKVRFPENGMGVISGPESNRLQNSILPFVTQENVPAEWQTASLKITTDQPKIDDDLKYLTIYFENRVSNTGAENNRSLATAYIDDITITDVGEFDPTSVEIEDAGKWTLPKEDSSIWKDWSSWITGKFESVFDADNDFNYYDYENSDNSFEDGDGSAENTENTAVKQPNRKKKIIKKVIVIQQSYVWVIIVVATAVALAGAGFAAFFIIKKRRGRKS